MKMQRNNWLKLANRDRVIKRPRPKEGYEPGTIDWKRIFFETVHDAPVLWYYYYYFWLEVNDLVVVNHNIIYDYGKSPWHSKSWNSNLS